MKEMLKHFLKPDHLTFILLGICIALIPIISELFVLPAFLLWVFAFVYDVWEETYPRRDGER